MDKLRLVDVGARDGIHPRWKPYRDVIEVRAFEPDPKECERLNRQRAEYSIKYLPNALGAKDGEQATLFICKQPGCSSLLRPNTELLSQFPYGHNMEVVGEEKVTLSRLDTVCRDFIPDVLKIDTQGTELDVLKGAGTLLYEITAIELEVEFIPLYVNQPLFADVDAFMRSKGFMLRGLRRTCWRNKADGYSHAHGGQLVHGDALYLRHEKLDTPTGHLILSAYQQSDLLSAFGVKHEIDDKWYARMLRRAVGGYPHREIRRFVDRLKPAFQSDWHDPDFY